MMRFTSFRWAGAAFTASCLLATALAAQPPRPAPPGTPNDPLEAAKVRQKIADDKATSEVLEAVKLADGLAKTNPARAVDVLKKAQTNVLDLAVGISGDARKNLTAMIQGRINSYGGKVITPPNPGPMLDPKGPEVKAAQKLAVEKAIAELKDVREGLDLVQKYQASGQTEAANREMARLAQKYPHNPSVIVLGQTDTIRGRLDDALALQKMQSDRMWKLEKKLQESALPAVMDVEFPKGWKELSERRLKSTGVQLTAKEKKIIEALDKPSTLNFNERPLDEALQDVSNSLDLPLLIDKKSLDDLGLDLKKGVSLQGKGLSNRTVLRSILAAQGLTFVVKDETIQIVTVEKAQNLLTTRVYYLGDLVQAGIFSGPEWGPVINGFQAQENAKAITDLITKSIDPLMWRDNGGPGTVTFHFPSKSLIVRASAEVHASLSRTFGGK